MQILKNRFPGRSEIIAVLGVSVFVCHSWSMRGFLNDLPSLLLYFRLAEMVLLIRGLFFIIVGSIAAYLLQKNLRYEFPSTQMLMFNLVIPLALIALFIAVSHVWVPLQKVLLDIQGRISIMLYIYVPIGVVSFFVVVFRNLS